MDIYNGEKLLLLNYKVVLDFFVPKIQIILTNTSTKVLYNIVIQPSVSKLITFSRRNICIDKITPGQTIKIFFYYRFNDNESYIDFQLKIIVSFFDLERNYYLFETKEENIHKSNNPSSDRSFFYNNIIYHNVYAQINLKMDNITILQVNSLLKFIQSLLREEILDEIYVVNSPDKRRNGWMIMHDDKIGNEYIMNIQHDSILNELNVTHFSEIDPNLSEKIKSVQQSITQFFNLSKDSNLAKNNQILASFLLGKYITTLNDYLTIDWDINSIIQTLNKIIKQLRNFSEFSSYQKQATDWIDLFQSKSKMSEFSKNQKDHFLNTIQEWENFFKALYNTN